MAIWPNTLHNGTGKNFGRTGNLNRGTGNYSPGLRTALRVLSQIQIGSPKPTISYSDFGIHTDPRATFRLIRSAFSKVGMYQIFFNLPDHLLGCRSGVKADEVAAWP